MYTDIERSITVLQLHIFPWREVSNKGAHFQHSCLLLVAEVLACTIRDNKSVKGTNVNNTTVKVTQLVDDMTIIVKDIMSLQLSLNIINMFYQASGLKLNYTKTEILATGRRAPFRTNKNPYRLKWAKDRVYALGTWFYKDHRKTVRENNNTKIAQVKESVKLRKSRKLTWFGK